MTNEEAIALFVDAGINDEYIDLVEHDLDSGEFWSSGTWAISDIDDVDSVIVEVPMYPAEVMAIDRRARQQGKTRNQLIRELATA